MRSSTPQGICARNSPFIDRRCINFDGTQLPARPSVANMKHSIRIAAAALAVALLIGSTPTAANANPSNRAKSADSLLIFSSLLIQNERLLASYALLGDDGQPLDAKLYEAFPPTGPDLGVYVSPPSFRIRPGVSFRLLIDGRLLTLPQQMSLTLIEGGSTHSIDLPALNQQDVSNFSFDAKNQVLALSAKGTQKIRIQVTHEDTGVSYAAIGRQLRGSASGGVFMRDIDPNNSIIFREDRGNVSTWEITLSRTTITGTTLYRATNIRVPQGGHLLVSYSKWNSEDNRPTLTAVSARPKPKSVAISLNRI